MAVDAQALFDHLWSTKYLPEYYATRQVEEQRRAAAFVCGPREVAGWPVRVMSAYDFLLLERAGSPFVDGRSAQALPDDLAFALWLLRADCEPCWFPTLHRDRQIVRWRRVWLRYDRAAREWQPSPVYATALRAFLDYLGEVFADSKLPGLAPVTDPSATAPALPPLNTHWIAPLMTEMACEMGVADPVTARPWADVPLPQLWQYRHELRARATGKLPLEDGPAAAIRMRCMDEVNAILAGTQPNPLAPPAPTAS